VFELGGWEGAMRKYQVDKFRGGRRSWMVSGFREGKKI